MSVLPISTTEITNEAPEITNEKGSENMEVVITNEKGSENMEVVITNEKGSDNMEVVSINEGKRKTPWSREEEEMLANSWLSISEETSTKYPMQNNKIWKRVCEYYNKNKSSGVRRKSSNLKSQWHFINAQVHEFNECFIQLKNKNHSGLCDHQIKEAALDVYYSTCKKNFRYEHVWNLVKNEPKWRATTLDFTKKKTKRVASSADARMSNDLHDNVVEIRPICQDTTKKQEKTKVMEQIHCELHDPNVEFHRENMKIMRKHRESMDTRNRIDENLLKVKEERFKMEEIQTLFKDTHYMTDEQLEMYRNYCNKVRAKYNL